MKLRMWMCGGVVASLMGVGVVRANDQDDAQKKQGEVATQIAKIQEQLVQLRRTIAESDDLAPERNARTTAQENRMARHDMDPKVHAARKAIEDAKANTRKVEAAEVDGSADVVAAQKAADASTEALEDLKSQIRLTEVAKDEARKKVERDPELQRLAPPGFMRYWMRRPLPPSTQTTQPSEKLSRKDAEKLYNDRLAAKLASDPDYIAQGKKIDELKGKIAETEAAEKAAHVKYDQTREKTSKTNTKFAEAHKAEKDAEEAERKTVEDVNKERTKAIEAAEKALNAKVDEKLAADPKAKELHTQLDDAQAQLRTLSEEAKKNAHPAPATRPAATTRPGAAAAADAAEAAKKLAAGVREQTAKAAQELRRAASDARGEARRTGLLGAAGRKASTLPSTTQASE